MSKRPSMFALAAALLLTGCHSGSPGPNTTPDSQTPAFFGPRPEVAAANQAFLTQKAFDPWILTRTGDAPAPPLYVSDGQTGRVIDAQGKVTAAFAAGHYAGGTLAPVIGPAGMPTTPPASLNLQTGAVLDAAGKTILTAGPRDLPKIWNTSDIVIEGDPEAQQVTHANLFYLMSSTYPGSDHSIPPMGLSSVTYGGHIFWDADVWMLPALIVQHPEYAKPIVAYRFKTLAQAKKNAQAHHLAGAEYAWESADTGQEQAPAEFAQERHITADAAFAAWQYYLWTGDEAYLKTQGWPILQATAQYWVSRVTKDADGSSHLRQVLSPDETAGVVDDDAWTNAVVRDNLRAATQAARRVGQAADPRWAEIAQTLVQPTDKTLGIPAEHAGMKTDRTFQAKQADTLLLIHPLGEPYPAEVQKKMLDFYTQHTMAHGPAMTASIHAVAAARLGLGQTSLDLFRESYRPFQRGPWDAFSEKRSTNTVYFLTGMAGCLQTVLYGFAGLHVVEAGGRGTGTRLAGDSVASLYADPHLPPGWGRLTIRGIRFRGKTLDLTVGPGHSVAAKPAAR